MIKRFLLLFFSLISISVLNAQELNCVINFDISNVQVASSDKQLLDNFKTAATNFMNTRKWTNDVYQPFERIDCNIYITIQGIPDVGKFQGTANIQSSRPVYESTYKSTVLNYFDKSFTFEYNPSQPFDFNENTYFSNLTSMLGYYAYIILGMDYDTYSKLGGNPWFEKARNIANVASSSSGDESWNQSSTTPNRYTLIANLTNQQYVPLREGIYTYHRLALDKFIKDPAQARKDIFEAIKKIKTVLLYDPSSIFIRSFFLAKSAELINIYKEAPSDMKTQVVEYLRTVDPLNGDKYETRILAR